MEQTVLVPANTTYTWTTPVSNPVGAITGGSEQTTGQPSISQVLTNTTYAPATLTYTVTPLSGTCSGNTFTVTVTVNPTPAITNMTATICSGGSFTVTPENVTNGIVPAGTTYNWPAPIVTGGITGGVPRSVEPNIVGTLTNTTNTPQTATYTVTPVAGSCTGTTFTVTVTVNPRPAVSNMNTAICSGSSFTVTPVNGTNGIVPANTTYTWTTPVSNPVGAITGGSEQTTGQPSISQVLTNTTYAPATLTYTVTPLSGTCSGNTFTVRVTVNPTPAITNMTATICSGGSFTVTPENVTNGLVPAGTTYNWPVPIVTGGITGGVPRSVEPNIVGTLTNTTNTPQTATYTVTPVAGSCTGTTFTVTVTVNPRPAVSNLNTAICSGSSFTVTPVNGTNGLVPANTTYTWTTPVSNPVGAITGGSEQTTGQPSISQVLTNTTYAPATLTYTVTPLSGTCSGNTFTVRVTVNPTPAITNMTATICSGGSFTVTPENVTNGLVPAGTTYNWPAPIVTGGITGGVPRSVEPNIVGTLTNTTNTPQTATYTVTPVAGSCTGTTFTVTVTVNPRPAPTISGPTPVCLNSTGNVYTTLAGQSNYIWTIVGGTITAGGGTTNNTATVTWTTSGITIHQRNFY